MTLLELYLGEEWELEPAGGATGEAYIAQQGEQKLFIKRNSSPFLAVLSAEGIVPKLLWTKRLENGDVITAQRWVCGRELKAYEMEGKKVAGLLRKIHRSAELLDMFKRIGNKPLLPKAIVVDLQAAIEQMNVVDILVEKAMIYLHKMQGSVEHDEKVVCHCDVNHNNWILSEEGDLFLIDWDGATVADPALDLGLLLYLYIPREKWDIWLKEYGLVLSKELQVRMHWYVVSQTIYVILFHLRRNEIAEVHKWKSYLSKLVQKEEDDS